ncbi:MAG: hypothetical protein V1733_04005 [bacterium]
MIADIPIKRTGVLDILLTKTISSPGQTPFSVSTSVASGIYHQSVATTAAEIIITEKEGLDVQGNDPIYLSGSRLAALRQQLEPRLKSVLRRKDFEEFDLERAYRIVVDMAAMLG